MGSLGRRLAPYVAVRATFRQANVRAGRDSARIGQSARHDRISTWPSYRCIHTYKAGEDIRSHRVEHCFAPTVRRKQRRDREGDWSMEDVLQLDLDLSALPLDEFAVVSREVTVEALTAGQAVSHCDGHCCNHCACPCVCCS